MKTTSIFASVLLVATTLMNAQWQLIGDQSDMNGVSTSIAISKNNNMIYNASARYGNLTPLQVFKWDFNEWAPVGNLGITNGSIDKIILDSSDNIYAIGSFTDSSNKYYVRFWNGSVWAPLGNLKSTSILSDIATDGVNIYVVGTFVNPNTGETCYINKWNGTQWAVVAESNFNGVIKSIATDSENALYAAGSAMNALNQVGVFKIQNGAMTEVGKLRATGQVQKILINKQDNRIISISGDKTAHYNPATNAWTTMQNNAMITDYEAGNNFVGYSGAGSFYDWYRGNVIQNTNIYMGSFPINSGQNYPIVFDKFGYVVYGDNQGKVYRWAQKIGGLATSEVSQNTMSITPNPTTGIFSIKSTNKMKTAEIYDPTGKLLKKVTPNATVTEINISGQPKGIYYIKTYSDKKMEAQKIILK